MNADDIKKKIRKFVIEDFLFNDDMLDERLKDDSLFLEEGIIDSTGMLELIAFIDEEFNIEIDDEEMLPENLNSVNYIVQFLIREYPARLKSLGYEI